MTIAVFAVRSKSFPYSLLEYVARRGQVEFSTEKVQKLAQRVGGICSICEAPTSGPSADGPDAVNNVGVAAHIIGARLGSRRHNPAMSPQELSSTDNGIWLCQTCAKDIDSDASTWTVLELIEAKVKAEQRARKRLGRSGRASSRVRVGASYCRFIKTVSAAYVPVHVVNEGRRAITLRRVVLRLGGSEYVPSPPATNLVLSNLKWLRPPPLRLESDDAITGAWYFGRSFPGGGPPVEAKAGDHAEIEVEAVGQDPQRIQLRLEHPDVRSVPGVPDA